MAEPEEKLKFLGIFGVRNDKGRGLLVESLEYNEKQYFFKYHDQPLFKHCKQMQAIVREKNVQRARKLHIDITPFLHEYLQVSDSSIIFRGTKLESNYDQIEKVYTMKLNKEEGIVKRKQTMTAKKQEKIIAHNNKVKNLYANAEAEFQAERAKRIEALFGKPGGNGGQGGSNGQRGSGGQSGNGDQNLIQMDDNEEV